MDEQNDPVILSGFTKIRDRGNYKLKYDFGGESPLEFSN